MAQAVWFMEMGGSEMQTTCDVFIGGGQTAAQVADALAVFWAEGLAANSSDELKLVGISYLGDVYDQVEFGKSSSDPEASSTSYIMQKNGLTKKGRFFMPGCTVQSITNDGRVVAATRAALDGVLATELAALTAANIQLRVGSDAGGFETIDSITTRPLIGLQGRRRFGR